MSHYNISAPVVSNNKAAVNFIRVFIRNEGISPAAFKTSFCLCLLTFKHCYLDPRRALLLLSLGFSLRLTLQLCRPGIGSDICLWSSWRAFPSMEPVPYEQSGYIAGCTVLCCSAELLPSGLMLSRGTNFQLLFP